MAKPRNAPEQPPHGQSAGHRLDDAGGGSPPGGPPPEPADDPLTATEEVLVVFVDHAACPWLRPLRHGFRHCFAALRQDGRWLLVDPLKRRLEVRLLPPADGFDLAALYVTQGHRVLRRDPPPQGEAGRPPPRRGAGPLLRPLTCVETIKRLVGVECAWTLTPWQLFRRLQSDPRAPFSEVR